MPNDFHNISKTFDVVYDTLRNRIMTPELPPATKLNRRELEAEFGVSQTPIRDAMTRLSDEHLIDIFRQSKTMVARINLEELHTVFLLRNSMINDLAERLAQGVSPADFECAHHIVRIQQLGLSANETLETFVEQQDMFVKSLYQMTRPVNVYNVLSEQTAPFLRYRLLDVGIQWRREQILDLNFETLEGIKDRDRDKITDALRQQLEALLKSQTELKENFPDYCT